MDADNETDCPKVMAESFAKRIRTYGARHPVSIVFARREYEAWFLASLETIVGHDLGGRPGLPMDVPVPTDCEAIRDAKGWISRRLPGSRIYKETEDQAPMTHLIDLPLARERSRSFRRLCHGVGQLVQAIDGRIVRVTPEILSHR